MLLSLKAWGIFLDEQLVEEEELEELEEEEKKRGLKRRKLNSSKRNLPSSPIEGRFRKEDYPSDSDTTERDFDRGEEEIIGEEQQIIRN